MFKPTVNSLQTDFCFECGRQSGHLYFLEESGEYLCRDCFRDSTNLIRLDKEQGTFTPGLKSYMGGNQ